MKLGRHPAKHDDRTFRLSAYLREEKLPPLPVRHNWGSRIGRDGWGVMLNMHLENCTCAAAGHFIMTWTSNTGSLFKPTDNAILKVYSALTGYDPATGANDTGAYSLDVLKHWRKFDIDGHKIFAFAAISPTSHREVKQTVYLFGGCYAGLGLPKSCTKQEIWDVPPEGIKGDGAHGSWGGHAVLITGYTEEHLYCITWGKEKRMTWAFWNAYCEEAYAILSDDFIRDRKTPAGIDISALREDLHKLKQS